MFSFYKARSQTYSNLWLENLFFRRISTFLKVIVSLNVWLVGHNYGLGWKQSLCITLRNFVHFNKTNLPSTRLRQLNRRNWISHFVSTDKLLRARRCSGATSWLQIVLHVTSFKYSKIGTSCNFYYSIRQTDYKALVRWTLTQDFPFPNWKLILLHFLSSFINYKLNFNYKYSQHFCVDFTNIFVSFTYV